MHNAFYVDSIEKVQYWRDRLVDENGMLRQKYLGFDTETNGVYFFRNVIIGYSIALNDNEGFYIPLLEWVPDQSSLKLRTVKDYGTKIPVFTDGHFQDVWRDAIYPENVTSAEYQAPDFAIGFLRDVVAKFQLIMYNAPFDCNMVKFNFGIDLAPQLYLDGILGKHFLDENSRNGLKDTGALWANELGFSSEEDAKAEQKELGTSVVRNGGKFNARTKIIWRGDPLLIAKYAVKDVYLTLKVCRLIVKKLNTEYEQKHRDLFFRDEIMPLCREVVIPMIYKGAHINVEHFRKLDEECKQLLNIYEERAIREIEPYLENFELGSSLDEIATQRKLVFKIAEIEGLELPKTTNKKGEIKVSFAKKAVQAVNLSNPHWLWGYILKENELMLPDRQIQEIKEEIFFEETQRRYRFNISSADHLIWLLFKRLGESMGEIPKTESSKKEKPRPKTDADTLEQFFLKKYPEFVTPILLHRKLSKLHSSYIEPALNLNNNGWLHLEFKQYGTISGRFSCGGGFNLQTLPKVEITDICSKCQSKRIERRDERMLLVTIACSDCQHVVIDAVKYSTIKEGFTAPTGYKIQNADYSSLEPRCFAFESGDQKLKDVFQKNLDLYSKVYCDMMDPEGRYSADPKRPNFLKIVNPAARDGIKPCVLSIPYGSRAGQVANLMGFTKTIKKLDDSGVMREVKIADVKRGEAFREKYLNTYSDLRNYMDECDIAAITKGYVETIYGRRRRFQYTQNVYKILSYAGITIDEFLDHNYNALKFPTTDTGLTEELLMEFCQAYDIYPSEIEKLGNWTYVRGVFKNELNNAKNIRIQGLAGHITNRAMLEYTRAINKRGLDARVFLTVHDEISCYVKSDQVELTVPLLKSAMERNKFARGIDVPMKADPVICDNLKDSK